MTADHPFWQFSLRIYGAPGVEDECLAVQERYGVDVNAMLLCAWLAAERRIALTPAEVQECREVTAEWNERCVKPLRGARRALKGLAGAETIRARVKQLELEAEQIQQEALYEFAAGMWPRAGDANPPEALRNNVGVFLRAHGASGVDGVPALIAAVDKDAFRNVAPRRDF